MTPTNDRRAASADRDGGGARAAAGRRRDERATIVADPLSEWERPTRADEIGWHPARVDLGTLYEDCETTADLLVRALQWLHIKNRLLSAALAMLHDRNRELDAARRRNVALVEELRRYVRARVGP